ncbi:MAG: hypothetical protein AAF842_03080 [Planctomycetota bacterium]
MNITTPHARVQPPPRPTPTAPGRQPYTAWRLFQLASIGLAAACLANGQDVAVAIAAPIAWAALLIVLLASDRRARVQHHRVSVCLDSAMLGSVVLLVGWLVDGISWPWLLASQVVMAIAFLTRWRRLGLSPLRAAAAWFGVLDGVFLLVWLLLWIGGVR